MQFLLAYVCVVQMKHPHRFGRFGLAYRHCLYIFYAVRAVLSPLKPTNRGGGSTLYTTCLPLSTAVEQDFDAMRRFVLTSVGAEDYRSSALPHSDAFVCLFFVCSFVHHVLMAALRNAYCGRARSYTPWLSRVTANHSSWHSCTLDHFPWPATKVPSPSGYKTPWNKERETRRGERPQAYNCNVTLAVRYSQESGEL